jgi:hypothetical protein
MKTKHCEWCDSQFESDISYQIYCSVSCREQATKEKIAARYALSRRAKRMAKKKLCKSCGQPISVYNDFDLCQACDINPIDVAKALRQIKGISNGKDIPE